MNDSIWRGIVAVGTTLIFGVGWTLGFIFGRVDGTLYLAGMGPLVTGVTTFYFAHELRNGVKQIDKLLKEKADDV